MLMKIRSFLLCLYGALYQIFVPCAGPDLLPANSLNTQQYVGKWYFIVAASHRERDIHMFRQMDSTVFTLETSDNSTLQLTGAMRNGDSCSKATWLYRIQPERDDLELVGRPVRRTLIWSGEWVNCPQCIILQEIEPPLSKTEAEDSLSRHMLYARQSDVDAEVVKSFQSKLSCLGLTTFVKLPQEKEFCT